MDINALETVPWMQPVDLGNISPGMQPRYVPGKNSDTESVEISEAGRFMEMMSGLSEEDRSDVLAFIKEMHEAARSGTFDASEMAEEAPDELKTFAEENGLDLEEMLTNMTERGEHPQGPPPPPPIGSMGTGDTDGLEDGNLIRQWFSDEDDEENIYSFLLSSTSL